MSRELEHRMQVGLLALLSFAWAGCASSDKQGTEAQSQFKAGMEETFAVLQRSGIEVVRVVGPFELPVLQWHEGMTLAETIVSAGYQARENPSQILIQRGPTAISIDPATLLSGEDVRVESWDVVHVFP